MPIWAEKNLKLSFLQQTRIWTSCYTSVSRHANPCFVSRSKSNPCSTRSSIATFTCSGWTLFSWWCQKINASDLFSSLYLYLKYLYICTISFLNYYSLLHIIVFRLSCVIYDIKLEYKIFSKINVVSLILFIFSSLLHKKVKT